MEPIIISIFLSLLIGLSFAFFVIAQVNLIINFESKTKKINLIIGLLSFILLLFWMFILIYIFIEKIDVFVFMTSLVMSSILFLILGYYLMKNSHK